MCQASEKNIDFLRLIHQSIQLKYNWFHDRTRSFMRVNVVIRAQTKWHTDTMRGATPSFILVEQGSSFMLGRKMCSALRFTWSSNLDCRKLYLAILGPVLPMMAVGSRALAAGVIAVCFWRETTHDLDRNMLTTTCQSTSGLPSARAQSACFFKTLNLVKVASLLEVHT